MVAKVARKASMKPTAAILARAEREAVDGIIEARRVRKEADKKEEECKLILSGLGKNAPVYHGTNFEVRVTTEVQRRLDMDAVKAFLGPEKYEEFLKQIIVTKYIVQART